MALVHRYTNVHFFLYAAIGFVACVGFGYLVSLFAAGDQRDLRGLTIHTQE